MLERRDNSRDERTSDTSSGPISIDEAVFHEFPKRNLKAEIITGKFIRKTNLGEALSNLLKSNLEIQQVYFSSVDTFNDDEVNLRDGR